MTDDSRMLVRVGHSPDPDDAFMFYALAKETIDTGPYRFEHELVDIETLNQRAFRGEMELTAVSLHAYAHVSDLYMLCNCGASMGDGYGPMVVAREPASIGELKDAAFAIPGTLTTAFLSLQLCLRQPFRYVQVPFDRILDAVEAGQWEGESVDAGLVIHEGQLTFADQGLHLVVDLGAWWLKETGLPLPLGANAIRRDLGPAAIDDIHSLLLQSIRYGLEHRQEALSYAMEWGRGLDPSRTDRFVDMYVNDWTLDFGPRGREAVATLLRHGYEKGIVPRLVEPQFVGVAER